MESGPTNVDAYIYDADCTQLASAANEGDAIPSGTAYVLTSLYAGAATDVTLAISYTQ